MDFLDRRDVAASIARGVRDGELSAREVSSAYLERIQRYNPQLNALVAVTEDLLMRQAAEVDAKLARDEQVGILAGVPCAIKDNICTRDVPTTCASGILRNWVAPYEATVVKRMRLAGAALAGKTNLDEFGMGSSTEFSIFGPSRNPHDTTRVAGGSSGGSAAAVAGGLVPVALGSDTGGSVRQPAALCGVVGVKPTYGRVSRYGLTAYGSSLEQVGVLARSVGDAALVLDAIAGPDDCDSTSIREDPPLIHERVNGEVRGLRVGILRELLGEGVSAEVAQRVDDAAEAFANLGADVLEATVPSLPYGLSAYYQIASAEASSNLSRYDGVRYGVREDGRSADEMIARSRSAGFGPEVRRRIMLGTYVLSAGYYDQYYDQARRVRTVIREDFIRAYESCDVLIGPTYPTTAFGLEEKLTDPLVMYAGDICTVSSNLAGEPALSLPFGVDRQQLPIGIQILAPAQREDLMFRAASALESVAPLIPLPPSGEPS
jgi:aspartyl-tRNA(Asn)/glutamyl-tRNA(Gln) amidotransferase subunit A